MAFKRHFARVGAAERCTESTFTDHQRQVCDYALVYAEKKNDGEAPYSVSFTATQNGDVIVQLHPHSQLERVCGIFASVSCIFDRVSSVCIFGVSSRVSSFFSVARIWRFGEPCKSVTCETSARLVR